jgi:ribosomal protein S18 acetylase RimI-like enzyme
VVQRSIVGEIEEALVGHWSYFGRWPRGALVEDTGTVRYETPIAQLPYNGVVRTWIEGDPEVAIERVLDTFARRDVAFVWWHHPTARPGDLGDRLLSLGLRLVEEATGMSLELEGRPSSGSLPSGLRFVEVVDEAQMRSYADLIFRYWEVPPGAHALVEEVNRYWGPGRAPVHRWIVLDESERAIGKALLSLAAPPGIAAIYGMSVTPEARGKGVASALTQILVGRAEALGCRRVVLHASEMAVGLYERAGFIKQCEMPVYANATLWATRET